MDSTVTGLNNIGFFQRWLAFLSLFCPSARVTGLCGGLTDRSRERVCKVRGKREAFHMTPDALTNRAMSSLKL